MNENGRYHRRLFFVVAGCDLSINAVEKSLFIRIYP